MEFEDDDTFGYIYPKPKLQNDNGNAMKVKINTKLLPYKGFFFCFWGANACIITYVPLLAKQIGLSITEVAVIWGIFPIVSLLGKPIIGGIADKYRRHKFVFLIILLLQTVFTFVMYLLPSISHPNHKFGTITCTKNQLIFSTCLSKNKQCIVEDLPFTCNMTCHFANKSQTLTFCENAGFQNMCLLAPASDISDSYDFNFSMELSKINLDTQRCIYSPISSFVINSFNSTVRDCDNLNPITCSQECDEEIFSCNRNGKFKSGHEFHTIQFWIVFITQVIAKLGFSSSVSLADAITFDNLKGSSQNYGQQRFWGSVSFALISLLIGKLIDTFSAGKHETDFGPGFYSYGILMVITVVVVGYMKVSDSLKSPSILKDVTKLFKNATVVAFVLVVGFVGMCTGLLYTFLYWYMTDKGANTLIIGLTVFIGCLCEIPFFFFASKIINKLNHENTMYFVFFCLAARMALISIVSNKWLFLPIELLHGVTFGLFYANMALYGMKIAPPGTMATIQGVLGATFEGIGMGLGSLIGGFIKDTWGPVFTFRCFSVACVIVGFLFFIFNFLFHKFNKQQQHNPSGSPVEKENPEPVFEETTMLSKNHTNENVLELKTNPHSNFTDLSETDKK